MIEDDVRLRLNQYLCYKSWTAKEFERKTGLGNGSAARLSGATRKTTFDRISKSDIDLNSNWLRTGEGEMLKPVTGQAASSSEDKDESFINLKREIDALKKELSLKDDLIASQRETIESQRDRINDLVSRLSSSDASLH